MILFWKKREREVGKCPHCQAPIRVGYPNTWCPSCSELLPAETQDKLPKVVQMRANWAAIAGHNAGVLNSATSLRKDSTPCESVILALRERAEALRTYAAFIMFGIISFTLFGILIFINAGYLAQEESSPALNQVRNISESLGVIRKYLLSTEVGERQQLMTITDTKKMSDQLNQLDAFNKTVADGIGLLQENARENKIPVLVSTVSQRVGIIVLLIFLIQILVPTYRYNIKLAAFYSARADALEILLKLPDNTLDKLIPILSPDSLDFGRTIPSPVEHVVEIIRETAKLGHSAADVGKTHP